MSYNSIITEARQQSELAWASLIRISPVGICSWSGSCFRALQPRRHLPGAEHGLVCFCKPTFIACRICTATKGARSPWKQTRLKLQHAVHQRTWFLDGPTSPETWPHCPTTIQSSGLSEVANLTPNSRRSLAKVCSPRSTGRPPEQRTPSHPSAVFC